jgi:hypothetical protein
MLQSRNILKRKMRQYQNGSGARIYGENYQQSSWLRSTHGLPVIPPEEHHAKWLGEVEDGGLKELLKPFPADQMKMWPISARANRPKNDDPDILTPIGAYLRGCGRSTVAPGYPLPRAAQSERVFPVIQANALGRPYSSFLCTLRRHDRREEAPNILDLRSVKLMRKECASYTISRSPVCPGGISGTPVCFYPCGILNQVGVSPAGRSPFREEPDTSACESVIR